MNYKSINFKKDDFKPWDDLANEFDNADFSIEKNRKKLNNAFTKVSKIWWKYNLESVNEKNMPDAADSLANIYFSFNLDVDLEWLQKEDPLKEAYSEAVARIRYSSDRMNINRWLHIRFLLNIGL